MLDSCVRQVYESVHPRFLKASVLSFSDSDPVRRIPIEKASFAIPTDCIRVLSVQCRTWERPITTFITSDMPEYSLQNNIYNKGGASKPKGYISQDYSDVDPTLTEQRIMVSPFTDANVNQDITVYYVKMPVLGTDDSHDFEVQADLLDGVFWFTAYSVLVSMKEVEFAKHALSKYQEFIMFKQV